MERREHYDPEDIEQLLMERSYDELLEEERAYVLRHLSGREEYEAMRALLTQVQRSEPDHELLDAEPKVRMEVMRAFRERDRPSWRIWLNSLGTVLLPRDTAAFWRPALALAGLALLIGIGLWVLVPRTDAGTQVAELRKDEAPARPTAPTPASVPRPTEDPKGSAAVANDAAAPLAAQVAKEDEARSRAKVLRQQQEPSPGTGVTTASDGSTFSTVRTEATDVADHLTEHKSVEAETVTDIALPTAASNSGYVTNWSVANATGSVTKEVALATDKQERRKDQAAKAATSQADLTITADERAMDLLRAAW